MGALFVMDSANNTNNLPVTLGILPAFTGWVTPPGTPADITNELTNSLTTTGQTDGVTDCYVTYNLGAPMRVSIFALVIAQNQGYIPMEIQVSDDGSHWDSATNIEDQSNILSCTALTQYIQLHLPAPVSQQAMTISNLNLRVYLL